MNETRYLPRTVLNNPGGWIQRRVDQYRPTVVPMITDPLRLALGTFTAFKVEAPATVDRPVAHRAMLLAPVVAVPLAAIAGFIVLVGEWLGLYPLATAVLAVAAVALGSRGLHWDGLADTADGLSSSYDRKKALDVMKRGDIGPMGVVTLVLVIVGQVGALAGAIAAGHGVFAALVGVIVGRLVLVGCCAEGIPAARAGGLGATVAGTVPQWQAVLAIGAVGVLAAFLGLTADLALWRGLAAVIVAAGAVALLVARCVQRLGGITGDVLGAAVEIATLGALITLAG